MRFVHIRVDLQMRNILFIFILLLSSFAVFGQTEICDNGMDDDGDGYVDFFDSDCACNDSLYQAQCESDCIYLPDSLPDFNMKMKWITVPFNAKIAPPNIVAGDIDGDGQTEILTFKYESPFSKILVFDGLSGELENEFQLEDTIGSSTAFLSIADVDRDGKSEIFVPINNSWMINIVCYDYLGNKLWKSPEIRHYLNDGAYNVYIANITDFNGDMIPEIYIGSVILNAQTGNILVVGNEGKGSNFPGTKYYIQNCASVAADLLDSPGLELAAGNTVYKVTINNVNGLAGNQMIPVTADSTVQDGLTAVADIDGDQLQDVITFKGTNGQGENGGVWVWNPRTQKTIASGIAAMGGGLPFIGNVDADCYPEIGIAFSKKIILYKYTGQLDLEELYTIPTSDLSGGTGITMFDFNQDNKNELVYRDETDLMIINGLDGKILTKFPLKSGTIMEYPIVVDIDDDHQAEILVNGYTSDRAFNHIFAFESGYSIWSPARSIWNQTAYNATNINDDLSIPLNPQNPAKNFGNTFDCLQSTCPQVYNSFMTQATFRTKQGCVQWQALDLQPHILEWNCVGDSIEIILKVENLNGTCDDSVYVQLFYKNPFSFPAEILKTQRIDLFLDENKLSDSIIIKYPVDSNNTNDLIYLLLNTKVENSPQFNSFPGGIPECDYNNNFDSIFIPEIKLDLDLGNDIFLCEHDSVVLHSPTGFEDYIWQDSIANDTITVNMEGDYFLQATNICGVILRDTISVMFKNPVVVSKSNEICQGDSIEFFGNILKDSGTYFHTINKCDSLFELNLIVNPVFNDSLYYSLCPGDSILIDGIWVTEPDEYRVEYSTYKGCDSIENIIVDKLNIPSGVVLVLDCTKGEVKASIDEEVLSNWTIEWSNGDTAESTYFKSDTQTYVIYSSETGCRIKSEFELPSIPDLKVIPVFSDTTLVPLQKYLISLDLDTSVWSVKWLPKEVFNCSTCMNVEINTNQTLHIYLELTHSSGCIYIRDFWINISDRNDFYIPNIFSPNSDGINDEWLFDIGENYLISNAFIFSRWGEKIKEWHEVNEIRWDGTFKNLDLNPGVYVYFIQFKDEKGNFGILKGDITLIK